MSRLLPKSLVGQIAVLMAVALLIAQAINFSLILTERQRLSLAQNEGPAVTRFVTAARLLAEAPADAPPPAERPRRQRLTRAAESLVPPGTGDRRLERRLRQAAEEAGLAVTEARAAIADRPPRAGPFAPDERPPPPGADRPVRIQWVALSVRLEDGSWINARTVTPRRDRWAAARLAGATLLLYCMLLGAMVAVAARLTRPLRDLRAAAETFEGRGAAPFVAPRGPDDLRRAILAFNDMNARLAALLDEKDHMLGAIGHDLRTPLASLRIRAEAVEPAEERERIVATLDEMAALLDDTLALARSGRSREPARAMDLGALADAVAEEFRLLGAEVAMENGGRVVAPVRPALLRRALRNLIDNALAYGGDAALRVSRAGGEATIAVEDRGPGIAEEALDSVQEPFRRLEASRNRDTGGTGLGLAIARAVAASHGGRLVLENRAGGGLSARIVLPVS